MEKGVTPEETLSWEEYLKESFSLPERDWEQYSPLTLAYIGDSVYDLLIRTVLVKRGNTQTARLHGGASRLVRAGPEQVSSREVGLLLAEDFEAPVWGGQPGRRTIGFA